MSDVEKEEYNENLQDANFADTLNVCVDIKSFYGQEHALLYQRKT